MTPPAPDAGSLITTRLRPPRGWRSGHLQTVRSRVVRRRYRLDRLAVRRVVPIDLADGTGDRLLVQVHRPRRSGPHRGLVALVHGLGGSSDSDYVRATAAGLLAAGFPVARVDLRSAGLSAHTTRLMYHAGRTADLRCVLRELSRQPESRSGQSLVGFSLGGAATLKLLGEPDPGSDLDAAVAISPPLDLTVGAEFLSQAAGGLYERFLVRRLRKEALRPGPDGSPMVSPTEAPLVRAARRLPDFDDAVTAPRNGWQDAAEYYRVNSALQYLPHITVPTLLIHSLDDPMIPSSPLTGLDWEYLERTTGLRREITDTGGHVGFHERGRRLPWYVDRTIAFLLQHASVRSPPAPA